MSHLEYERNEPGTGSPPAVSLLEDVPDKAIVNGWRRNLKQNPENPVQVGDPYADYFGEGGD